MSKPIVDPAFDAWVATLPPKHRARYNLSAARLGWDAHAEADRRFEFVGYALMVSEHHGLIGPDVDPPPGTPQHYPHFAVYRFYPTEEIK